MTYSIPSFLIGMLVCWLIWRAERKRAKAEIAGAEAWNDTLRAYIADSEIQKEQLEERLHEANLIYVEHMGSHVCVSTVEDGVLEAEFVE
jgi:hypothetical protein